MVFTPDGTTLATVIAGPGERGDKITFWDLSRAKERSLISTGKEYVNSLEFTRDSRTLVAGCEDGTVLFVSADR
jgi:WD40 repeat protein